MAVWFNLSLFPSVAYGSDGLTLKFNLSLFLKCGSDGLTWASFSSVAVTANLSLLALMGNLILSF